MPRIQRVIILLAMSIGAMPTSAQKAAGNAENGKRLFSAYGCYECHGRVAQGGAAGLRLGPQVSGGRQPGGGTTWPGVPPRAGRRRPYHDCVAVVGRAIA